MVCLLSGLPSILSWSTSFSLGDLTDGHVNAQCPLPPPALWDSGHHAVQHYDYQMSMHMAGHVYGHFVHVYISMHSVKKASCVHYIQSSAVKAASHFVTVCTRLEL